MKQQLRALFAAEGSAAQGREDVEEAKNLLVRANDYFDVVTPSGPCAPIALALAALTFAYEHRTRANSNGSVLADVGLNTTLVESKDSTSLNQEGFNSLPSLGAISALFSDENKCFVAPPEGHSAHRGPSGEIGPNSGPPVPDVSAALHLGPYQPPPPHSGRFRLTPPPAPKGARPSTPVLKAPIDANLLPVIYALCYGADNAEKWRAISQRQTMRVVGVLQKLQSAGADLSRLGEFKTWWASWAKYAPTPEQVQENWWRAMQQIDAQFVIPAHQGPPTAQVQQDFDAAVRRMQLKGLEELGVQGGPQW